MFVRAQVPKSRTSLTPQNFKPICIESRGDTTPNRSNNISYHEPSILVQDSSHASLNNYTGRVEDRKRVINQSASNVRSRHASEKENIMRAPGTSFGGNQPSTKELQQTVTNLKKQKEEICITLQETLQHNNVISQQIEVFKSIYEIAQKEIEIQAQEYQSNLDEFIEQFNELNNKIYLLEEQNVKLAEQNEHQQWYLQQIQCQSSRFNQTHNFGSS